MIGNLYDRTQVEVRRTFSIHHVSGQVRTDKEQLELFNSHFVVMTLKPALVPNFSQICEVKWLRVFEKVRKLQTVILCFVK